MKSPSSFSILLTGLLLNLTGCSDNEMANSKMDDHVLANINASSTIVQNDLPMADQIKLFNSEFQLHLLTLSSLRETIEKKHTPNDALTWNLTTPAAPTVQLNIQPSWQRSFYPIENKSADDEKDNNHKTITLDVMCSYVSRPCSDIMSAVEEFSLHASINVNMNFYDYWQPYHKNAQQAAAAVYCSKGEARTLLQQALWLRQGNINMQQLTANIDVYNHGSDNASKIYACMQSKETISFLHNNHKQLQSQGFRQTPTVLLNGQYVSRGQEVSQIFNSIYPHMNLAIEQGDRSITWLQSWLGSPQTKPRTQTDKNWAILEHNGKVLRLDKGANITDMYLANIEKERIVFYQNGRLLAFGKPSIKSLAQPIASNTQTGSFENEPLTESTEDETYEQNTEEETDHQARYESMVASIKPQPLPQTWLEEQLMRQSELEESLFHTEGRIEGKALVKLNKESIDEFYSSLGMMPGDVIMRVNDDWIHEDSNTLFQSLANEEKVTISVMRKGLPVHLAFEVTQ